MQTIKPLGTGDKHPQEREPEGEQHDKVLPQQHGPVQTTTQTVQQHIHSLPETAAETPFSRAPVLRGPRKSQVHYETTGVQVAIEHSAEQHKRHSGQEVGPPINGLCAPGAPSGRDGTHCHEGQDEGTGGAGQGYLKGGRELNDT